VHLCEACELLGRHAWGPEHVRLRKMGAPAPLVAEGNAAGGRPEAHATFMMHPTSGRAGFADFGDQRAAPVSPFFSPTAPKANEEPPIMFGMAHLTSGRQGFAPAGAPPGASGASPFAATGPAFPPPPFPSIFGAGGAPPPPSA
jgi:hypothetical protein